MTNNTSRSFERLWLSAWPVWTLLVFASLAAVRFLPNDYARAVVATPIVLMVPGSLTLGAVFAPRRRPQGTEFVCYAVLLSAIWSAFVSLILNVCGALITADSTYLCLLAISFVLTVAAEARFLLERQGGGRRVVQKLEPEDPDMSAAEAADAETQVAFRGAGYYAIVAAVAGAVLLASGLYTYDHLPRPTPIGYTSIAWTGPQVKTAISIGPKGKELSFQIIHHQPDTTAFRLSAIWLGNPSQSLAEPLDFNIGPNRTFRGSLLIPPLPDGCTYRVVVALTATRHVDPLTNKQETWSINADVHDPAKPTKRCT